MAETPFSLVLSFSEKIVMGFPPVFSLEQRGTLAAEVAWVGLDGG